MAKYCRYCGEVMKQPKDRFCYSCRRSGDAVDRYYRKIKEEDKIPLTEDEQDLLRGAGMETMACAGLIILFPLPFVIWDMTNLLAGGGSQLSAGIWITFIAITALSVKMFILGCQLYMLKRKACGKRLNIFLYKEFYSITHVNSNRLRYKNAFRDYVVCTMEKFALGADGLPPEREIEGEREKANDKNWRCGFCGYENTYSHYSCKSCDKERIKEKW